MLRRVELNRLLVLLDGTAGVDADGLVAGVGQLHCLDIVAAMACSAQSENKTDSKIALVIHFETSIHSFLLILHDCGVPNQALGELAADLTAARSSLSTSGARIGLR